MQERGARMVNRGCGRGLLVGTNGAPTVERNRPNCPSAGKSAPASDRLVAIADRGARLGTSSAAPDAAGVLIEGVATKYQRGVPGQGPHRRFPGRSGVGPDTGPCEPAGLTWPNRFDRTNGAQTRPHPSNISAKHSCDGAHVSTE